MGMTIIKPGILTTVQDGGRLGHQNVGVPVSGAMDELALRVGNMLLTNDEHEAAIECTLMGPTIRFEHKQLICIAGADLSPTLNGNPVSLWKPLLVDQGDILAFGKRLTGMRCYICVYGGLQIPKVLGSLSTYLGGNFGGFEGRALQANDYIAFRNPYAFAITEINWRLDPTIYPTLQSQAISVLAGPHLKDFEELSIVHFLSEEFTIGNESNRIGYRLETDYPLQRKIKKDILSSAVTFGTIQVTPQGMPIILMADRGTTGGYPIIAQVASIDLPLLAQCIPSEKIVFKLVSLQEAQQLYRQQEQDIQLLKKVIAFKYDK